MVIRLFKKFVAKTLYKIINSTYYDELKPNDNSVIYVRKNLKKVGNNLILPSSFAIKNPQYISIGDHFSSLYNLRIEAWDNYMIDNYTPEIIIGNNVSINTDCHIGCINKIHIGNNTLIASRVFITDHAHGTTATEDLKVSPKKRRLYSKGPVIIEDNVWIGEGVCILSGVTIGKNSIVGANAVVNKSFPENSIILGVPAKKC